MMTYEEIERRAHEIAMEMSPLERASLGVLIIETIRQADQFTMVNFASRLVAEHGDALCKASMNGQAVLLSCEYPTDAITHEPIGQESEPPHQSKMRAALTRLKEVSDHMQDSVVGDLIALVGLATIFWAGLFLTLLE